MDNHSQFDPHRLSWEEIMRICHEHPSITSSLIQKNCTEEQFALKTLIHLINIPSEDERERLAEAFNIPSTPADADIVSGIIDFLLNAGQMNVTLVTDAIRERYYCLMSCAND